MSVWILTKIESGNPVSLMKSITIFMCHIA